MTVNNSEVENEVFTPFFLLWCEYSLLGDLQDVACIESSKNRVINKTIGTPDRPVMRVPMILHTACGNVVRRQPSRRSSLRLMVVSSMQLKSVETGHGRHI
jgi:hypothetical protein